MKIGEDGVSYFIDGAPFEFKYSYTETPAANPIRMRQPPFVPFGPGTMPRPWTGRTPKDLDSVPKPPGPFSDGAGPRSREEILGEPLTKEEINGLVEVTKKTTRQLNIGTFFFFNFFFAFYSTLWFLSIVTLVSLVNVI